MGKRQNVLICNSILGNIRWGESVSEFNNLKKKQMELIVERHWKRDQLYLEASTVR